MQIADFISEYVLLGFPVKGYLQVNGGLMLELLSLGLILSLISWTTES